MSNTQRLLVSRNQREGWYFGVRWEDQDSRLQRIGKKKHNRTHLRWLSLQAWFKPPRTDGVTLFPTTGQIARWVTAFDGAGSG